MNRPAVVEASRLGSSVPEVRLENVSLLGEAAGVVRRERAGRRVERGRLNSADGLADEAA